MTTEQAHIQKIIDEIFDSRLSENSHDWHKNLPPPTHKTLTEIVTLLHEKRNEEDFQRFFSKNPTFLFRAVPSYGDTNVGVITKLPIGNSFISDFAVFTIGQGGCKITLIEIEKPSDDLFTKKLTYAQKLNTAIGQVTEWSEWINLNKRTFIRDSIESLKKSPKINGFDFKGSFKTMDNESIESGWNIFHGFSEYCIISSIIVIGRWSRLKENEKKRLLFLNNPQNSPTIQIRTYDQVIRKCFAIETP